MQASFTSYSFRGSILQKLSQELDIPANTNRQETHFEIPEEAGDGQISYFRFHDGLSIFLFDGQVKNDWEWQFQCEQTSPVYMFYLTSGTLEDVKYEENKRFRLNPMETLMIVQPGGSMRRSIVFKAGERIRVAVLSLVKGRYLEQKKYTLDSLSPEMQLLFSATDSEVKAFFPPDRSTIQSMLTVQEILGCEYGGLLRTCFVEAKARELLLYSFQRTQMEFISPDDKERFKNLNLEKVAQAHAILLQDLKNAPTIEELSKQVGLNRQKLKTDFKTMYGATIYQCLSEERMNTAKCLLLQGQQSIREVAAEVGYQNPSHFSRRFQEQFGLLPSELLSTLRQEGEAD